MDRRERSGGEGGLLDAAIVLASCDEHVEEERKKW